MHKQSSIVPFNIELSKSKVFNVWTRHSDYGIGPASKLLPKSRTVRCSKPSKISGNSPIKPFPRSSILFTLLRTQDIPYQSHTFPYSDSHSLLFFQANYPFVAMYSYFNSAYSSAHCTTTKANIVSTCKFL